MFLGTHTPKLDDKGRLTLPARYRDELRAGLMITKGQDRCLFVFPREVFEELAKKVSEAPFTNEGVRAYQRYLFSGTVEAELDKQGRVTLPANLMAKADLGRDVVVAGVGEYLEVWDRDAWRVQLDDVERRAEVVAERLAARDS